MHPFQDIRWIFTALILICTSGVQGQGGYTKGNVVSSFAFNKILNYPKSSSSFDEIKKSITVIDFFGTWCVPCIKALPHLKEIQERYKDDVTIVLVSIEEESKLANFVAARSGFSLPIVIDADNKITDLFQPPSYPYSVILDRSGKILSTITDAKQLTEQAIEGWIKEDGAITSPVVIMENKKPNSTTRVKKSSNAVVQLSQEFIYAAKTGDPLQKLKNSLADLDYTSLKNALPNDAEKNAFWINIYNAYSNALLKENPERYKKRNKFFSAKQIIVAGKHLSLDEIEHDFLRRTKIKWSLGHLSKLFSSKRAKELRVDRLDYRIHFALNCGAKSCPPIAYYTPEDLEIQLQLATKNYLTSEAEYKKEENIIYLPAILSWFRADFGGKKGMKAILKNQGLLSKAENPKIRFKKYDWTLELNNYKTE